MATKNKGGSYEGVSPAIIKALGKVSKGSSRSAGAHKSSGGGKGSVKSSTPSAKLSGSIPMMGPAIKIGGK